MSDIWFVEERNIFGGWSPARYEGDEPTEKRIGGPNREIRGGTATNVPAYLKHLTVAQLRELYSPDGKFAAQSGVKREAVA